MNRDKFNQIYDAVQAVNRVYEAWSAKHGLTLYEMQIYYVIIESKKSAITQKDLCRQLDAPKTSINSIVKKQLKTGRIKLSVNPDDKREKTIALTEEGKKFAENLICPLLSLEDEAMAEIDESVLNAAIKAETGFAESLLEKMGEYFG